MFLRRIATSTDVHNRLYRPTSYNTFERLGWLYLYVWFLVREDYHKMSVATVSFKNRNKTNFGKGDCSLALRLFGHDTKSWKRQANVKRFSNLSRCILLCIRFSVYVEILHSIN